MNGAEPHEPWTPEQAARLRAIAREQRRLLLCILVYFGMSVLFYMVFTRGIAIPITIVRIAAALVVCASVLFGVKLASLFFGLAGTLLCGLLLISPVVAGAIFHQQDLAEILGLVSLVTLFVINGRATRALKAAGIRVGLLGAELRDVEARAVRE